MEHSDATLKKELWLDKLETIKVFAHKTRLSIIKHLATPHTVKALSKKLAIPPSKLYYHINMLERHKLIQVVNHSAEVNLVEKVYQATAKNFKLINPLIQENFPDTSARALFETSLNESRDSFLSNLEAGQKDHFTPPRHPFYSKKSFSLNEAQLTALHQKLDALIQEVTQFGVKDESSDDDRYELSLLFYKQHSKGDKQ